MTSFWDAVNTAIALVQKGSQAGVVKEWQTRKRKFETPSSSNVAFIGEDGTNLHIGYKKASTVYVVHGAAGEYDKLEKLNEAGASMGHETRNLRSQYHISKIEGGALVPVSQPTKTG